MSLDQAWVSYQEAGSEKGEEASSNEVEVTSGLRCGFMARLITLSSH